MATHRWHRSIHSPSPNLHHRPSRTRRIARVLRLAALAVLIAVVGTVLSPTVANAVPSSMLFSTVVNAPPPAIAEVQGQRDKLHEEAGQATERYNKIQAEFEDLQRSLSETQAKVSAHSEEITKLKTELGVLGATADRPDGLDRVLRALFSNDPETFLTRASALDQLPRQKVDTLHRLMVEEKQLEQDRLPVAKKLEQVGADRELLASQKAAIEAKLAEADQLLSRLKAEERARAEAAERASGNQSVPPPVQPGPADKPAAEQEAERANRERLKQQWVLPLLHYKMSAGFGRKSRLWRTSHTGQDFSAPLGTPVRSAHAGTVTSAGWDGSYGQKIVVRHEDGTETWYCHLSAMVARSGTVEPGQLIGKVGSTGNSTGPHLHFEVRVKGSPVNPLTHLRGKGLNP